MKENFDGMAILITSAPGVVDKNMPGAFTKEALEHAVVELNKRQHVGGEYDRPSAGKLRFDDYMRRLLCVDEARSALSAKNFAMTDEGIVADITFCGPYADIVRDCIDEGMFDSGKVAFRLRALYRSEDWRNGLIHKIIPVAVDFVHLR